MLGYLKFYFKQQLYGKEHQCTTSPFVFFLKKRDCKAKKNINISYLIMVQIKMKLLTFFILSRYVLVCKYRITSQISIYNWK